MRGTPGPTEMVSGGSHGSATSQVTTGAWADVMGSNGLTLLLGEDQSRLSQGCRVWEQNLEAMCKGYTSIFFHLF